MLISTEELTPDLFLGQDKAVVVSGPYSVAVKVDGEMAEISFDDEAFSDQLYEGAVRKLLGDVSIASIKVTDEAAEQKLPFHQNRFVILANIPRGELANVIKGLFEKFQDA